MGSQAYTDLAKRLRELPAFGRGDPKQALVQAATLAASSHNTQPWTFRANSDSIVIKPDLSRRCEVVDPDDSHLFKSLGCAAANIVAAAPVYGFRTDVQLEDDGQIVIGLTTGTGKAVTDRGALKAIAERQCTKTPYDGRPLGTDETAELESAGSGEGVHVQLIDDATLSETILDLVTEGNRLQLSDPAFRSELIAWIRFNDTAAIRSGDGLSGRASGQPQLPTWLAKPVLRFVLTPQAQVKKDTVNLRSSAGIAVFIGETDELRTWVETGQAYERFALRATELGIRNAFINQPIEVRTLRSQLHSALGLRGSETAHLMVRYGRAALAPYSLRRRIADVRAA